MTEQNKIAFGSTDKIEDIVIQLHHFGLDADVTQMVIGQFRRMYGWSREVMTRLELLEAQYVTPFLVSDPELPSNLLEAIEAGTMTYAETKAISSGASPEILADIRNGQAVLTGIREGMSEPTIQPFDSEWVADMERIRKEIAEQEESE